MNALRVLIVGAGGFIGGTLAGRLEAAGHTVLRCGRWQPLACDFRRDTTDDWLPRLEGVDAVVNAAGAARGDLATAHAHGPVILFEACLAAGIPTVIQVSALGAGDGGTEFLRTKKIADDRLRALANGRRDLNWWVARPSLVVGRGGVSTRLFTALAASPVIPAIGDGQSRLQPVHVDDLCAVIEALILRPPQGAGTIDVGGAAVMTTDEITAALRRWIGLKPAPRLPVPFALLAPLAWIADKLKLGALTPDMLAMLRRGNIVQPGGGDAWPAGIPVPPSLVRALGRSPGTPADRLAARLLPLRPLLRCLLAAVWLGTAYASAFAWPLRDSLGLLASLGLGTQTGTAAVYLGAGLDALLGGLLLLRVRPVAVCRAQLVLMLVYTGLATIIDPALWAHPFGPLLKNLAVLGATLALAAMEAEE